MQQLYNYNEMLKVWVKMALHKTRTTTRWQKAVIDAAGNNREILHEIYETLQYVWIKNSNNSTRNHAIFWPVRNS